MAIDAAVENRKDEKLKELLSMLHSYGIDVDAYEVLCNFKDPDDYKEKIEELKQEGDYDDIYEDLVRRRLIAYGETKDDGDRITHKGKTLVRECQKLLYEYNTMPESETSTPFQTNSIWDEYIIKDERHRRFFTTLAQFNIRNIPKIKCLSEDKQIRYFDEVLNSNIHYCVALLYVIDTIDYLTKTFLMTKEKAYKLLSKATGHNNQTFRQNFCGCNPDSTMVDPKYLSKAYITNAKHLYHNLLN